MEPYFYILLGTYIVTCAIGLAVTPLVQTWMPASLQPGRSRAWLGSVVCLLAIVFSPMLLLGLVVYLPTHWAVGVARQYAHGRCTTCTMRHNKKACKQEQKQRKREKKASDDLLEAGCNFEDSVLSLSDMPPMYEDCLFKKTPSSTSPRSSLY